MPEADKEVKVKQEADEAVNKRQHEDDQQQQQQQPKPKKKRPLSEMRDIPTPAHYQISFMHRSVVTHVVASWKHAYIMTASADGIVKFWKRTQVVLPELSNTESKKEQESHTPCLEFVKSFKAHVGPVSCLKMEEKEADVAVSIGQDDGMIKLYDVSTFDVTAMIKTHHPIGSSCASFFRTSADQALFLAMASSAVNDGRIFIFSMDTADLGWVQTIPLHATATVTAMAYNAPNHAVYTADSKGILEVWDCSGRTTSQTINDIVEDNDNDNHQMAASTTVRVGGACSSKINNITYSSKMDTQLYQLVKNKTHAIAMCVLPKTGSHVFVYGADNRIRIFHHASGSIVVKYDERLTVYDKSFAKYNMDVMDYGKRAATEREMASTTIWSAPSSSNPKQQSSALQQQRLSLQVDPSGKFLFLPTLLGVKVIDWQRNKLVKVIGKSDASQLRFISVCHCWGDAKINRQMQLARGVAAISSADKEVEEAKKAKPESDALVIALAYDKRRFYVFSHLDPLGEAAASDDKDGNNADNDPAARRDIWNEPPTAEDRLGLRGDALGGQYANEANKQGTKAILRTTMGDIHIKLFAVDVPKTVENFCGHAKSGYYDNVIFHRVIKGFMLQTGDPLGDGTGGESIWGGEFEDEFVRDLRHDRPFTVSMANAGPNTNGSQFFITTVPTPWLDQKHSVFGRVERGMDVCTLIENAKTDDNDKPLDEIRILSIDIE